MISQPLPPDLNLILNAKTAVTIGPLAQVTGDVGSSGILGSVLFDTSSVQFSQFLPTGFRLSHVLASTITVGFGAGVGSVLGNDITLNGSAFEVQLGLDPTDMPQVPAGTPANPGTTNVSTQKNQTKQLCPGQYGAISLGANSLLNLNGGVYQVTRLSLADGARLEPSEPVVILVSGNVTTGTSAFIRPSFQANTVMTAADIRIEVGGAVTLGDGTVVRAHLLVPNGKFTTGSGNVTGAVWAKTINIGPNGTVIGEGEFSAQTPSGLQTCDDHNVCTTDRCVTPGGVAFCQNTPLQSGTSCSDGDVCNGAETCDGLGDCVAGTPPEVDDHNECTADACDAGGVSHTPVPDGTPCSGVGVCQAGVCTVASTVLSNDF